MEISAAQPRILFVDDEPGIRLTLPLILQKQGFEVTTVETVSEALAAISAQPFEVLISDLNIGEPGDGFTVVSAMRRTQPRCVNFILTGYPAFESALQAIRSQVDDYFVKPADVRELVERVNSKLNNPSQRHNLESEPFPKFLHTHSGEIIAKTLAAMKSHPRLSILKLTDAERVAHLPGLLAEIVQQLESQNPREPTDEMLLSGNKHGETRRHQDYTPAMLVDDTRLLDSTTYSVVQDHLLRIELSDLIPKLSGFNEGLEAHLQAALGAFQSERGVFKENTNTAQMPSRRSSTITPISE